MEPAWGKPKKGSDLNKSQLNLKVKPKCRTTSGSKANGYLVVRVVFLFLFRLGGKKSSKGLPILELFSISLASIRLSSSFLCSSVTHNSDCTLESPGEIFKNMIHRCHPPEPGIQLSLGRN